jgi:hypothetical protein
MAAPLTKRQRSGHIDSIQSSKILNVLEDHVLNGTEMAVSRITAGLGLLKKTIPDLKQTEHSGTVAHVFPGVHIHPPG